ncbi:MAG: ribosome maturation factor RimP, partial [Bacillota bacterium]
MGKISEVVYSLADPVVEAQKLKLVDVDFLKEGSDWVLRIFIENPGDQDLKIEDCEKVSRIVS